MTDNGIRDEGAKAISEMMKLNNTFTTLNLSREKEKKAITRRK